MKSIFSFTLLFTGIVLSSCSGEPKDSCKYDKNIIAARVMQILPSADGESAEIIFNVVNNDGKTIELKFSDQFGAPAYTEDLNEMNVHAGDSVKCEHQTLKSGNCEPEKFTLTREKY